MIQTNIIDMLKLQVKDYEDHLYRIYIVHEDDVIFYVGMALLPMNRMIEHCYGGRGKGPSHLGNFIRSFAEEANNWQVDLLTLEDCKPYVDQYGTFSEGDEFWLKALPDQNGLRDGYWLTEAMRAAEGALIQHYHPCLNIAGNPNPMPLPERYR